MKTQQAQHTPTPWSADLSTVHGPGICAEYQEREIVCSVINRADAAFIVRAVNAHEELILKLKWAVMKLQELGCTNDYTLGMVRSIDACSQAIAKAEGK